MILLNPQKLSIPQFPDLSILDCKEKFLKSHRYFDKHQLILFGSSDGSNAWEMKQCPHWSWSSTVVFWSLSCCTRTCSYLNLWISWNIFFLLSACFSLLSFLLRFRLPPATVSAQFPSPGWLSAASVVCSLKPPRSGPYGQEQAFDFSLNHHLCSLWTISGPYTSKVEMEMYCFPISQGNANYMIWRGK